MVAVSITWIGDRAPECANAEVLLYDEADRLVDEASLALATEQTAAGRRTADTYYFIQELYCGRVEVRSYGHVVSAPIEGRCDADAGVDTSPTDAGEPGAGAHDAG